MLGTYFTFPELLIWLPLLAGILCFFLHKGEAAKNVAVFSSIIIFAVSLISLLYTEDKFSSYNNASYYWMKYIGSTFYVGLDGTSRILTLLTAIAYPIIFIAEYNNKIKNPASFFGLMLLTQSGIMGVFCSMDALLFYFFWELAIIPVYFLCSIWGGEKRIKTTFKFFVYTFTAPNAA
jgi:NADH-quinone oxidoreductase subunit M